MSDNDAGLTPLRPQRMTSPAGAFVAPDTPAFSGCLVAAHGVLVRAADELNAILFAPRDQVRRNAIDHAPPSIPANDAAAKVATLEAEFGESFAPGDRAAWLQAYAILAKTISRVA